MELVADRPFPELLDEVDAARAEVVHLGTDRDLDVATAQRHGLYVVWITSRPALLERGMLGVESLQQLQKLLSEEGPKK